VASTKPLTDKYIRIIVIARGGRAVQISTTIKRKRRIANERGERRQDLIKEGHEGGLDATPVIWRGPLALGIKIITLSECKVNKT